MSKRTALQSLLAVRREILNRIIPQDAAPREWYSIHNADGGEDGIAEVRIYDEIGYWGITAEDFARDLDGITASKIVVGINSPGGDVFDSIAIYNALRMHSAEITTRVDGLAASGASIIAQAGDERQMVEASQMMIHNAWGLAIGDASVMRDFAALLERQDDVLAGIYATAAGDRRRRSHYKTLMAATTWMTDEEAVAEKLADKVVKPAKAGKGTPSGDAGAADDADDDTVDELADKFAKAVLRTLEDLEAPPDTPEAGEDLEAEDDEEPEAEPEGSGDTSARMSRVVELIAKTRRGE